MHSDSPRCQPTDSSNPLSGTSMLCSFPNSTPLVRCRTHSTSRVSSLNLAYPHCPWYSGPPSARLWTLGQLLMMSEPSKSKRPSEEYYKRVRKVHEEGGYGSIGYRAPFSREESEKLLLRTHTTAVSTDMLYKLANQEGGFKPSKLFSIDRVFR
jgi:hypothetical protein